jgi:hypothetical protein
MPIKESWLFPVIQSIHLCGIALLVGSITLVDLRQLGYLLTGYEISDIVRRLEKWTRIGLAIVLTTGPVLFAADMGRYFKNPAFLLKMAALIAALVFHFMLHNRTRPSGKVSAVVSLVLWTCVVLGGRAIADFDL